MERLALVSAVFFSLLIGTSGSLSTAKVAARKGYLPILGALAGGLTGFVGGLLSAIILAAQFSGAGANIGLGALLGGLLALNMLWRFAPERQHAEEGTLPSGHALQLNIKARHVQGTIMRSLFIVAIAVALVALSTLIWTIVNRSFGLTAVEYAVQPEALTVSAYEIDGDLGTLGTERAASILAENVRLTRLHDLVLGQVANASEEAWPALRAQPVGTVLASASYDEALAGTPVRDLTATQATDILAQNLATSDLETLAFTEAGRPVQALSNAELASVLAAGVPAERLQELILTELLSAETGTVPGAAPVRQVVKLNDYPEAIADKPFNQLTPDDAATILMSNLGRATMEELVIKHTGAHLIKEVRPLFRVQRPLDDLSAGEMADALAAQVSAARLQDLVLDMAGIDPAGAETVQAEPIGQILRDKSFPDALAFMRLDQLNASQAADILMQNLSENSLRSLVEAETDLTTFEVGRPLQDLPPEELESILVGEVRLARLRVLVLEMAGIDRAEWATVSSQPVSAVLGDLAYDDALASVAISQLEPVEAASLLAGNLTPDELRNLVFVEARSLLLADLPETELATVLAENLDVERLHQMIASEVLLAGNPDWPEIALEPVLSKEQAADILMRNLEQDELEVLVVAEVGSLLLAELSDQELVAVMGYNVLKETLLGLVLDRVVQADRDTWSDLTPQPIWVVMKADTFAADIGELPFDRLTAPQAADILARNLARVALEELVTAEAPGRPLAELSQQELGSVMAVNIRKALLRKFLLSEVAGAGESEFASLSPQPVSQALKGENYPEHLAETPINQLNEPQAADLLARNLSRSDLEELVFDNVVQPEVIESWTLGESLTDRDAIESQTETEHPQAVIKWHSWVNWDFLTTQLDPRRPDVTGIRPALYGTLMIVIITIVFAFPIGVGAAIYLEEYAGKSMINQVIQTNINNLAGVPSIIYGILGLAIFVRALEHLTSGNVFGTDTANGRTILSAGFTLALLILPLIIINAQEAIRAVPNSLRQASYGLGATHWQTIWNHVLPYAMPGILTGTILAISRAIGETAPLILVGGATYLTQDPEGPFSIFTALPLIIYRWTTLPQAEFRNAAAAAIIVLLVMLLTLNSIAVFLRNRFSRRLT